MAGEKEYDYVVTVKKQGQATFTAISILLIIIGVAANLFFYFVINNNSTLFGSFGNSFFQQDWLVPFLIPVAIFLTALELYRQKRGNYIASFGWPLSLCGIAFIIGPTHTFLFAALYFIASFFERQAKHPLEFGFDKNGIILNSFPSKQYNWDEVINVILKDGMLTVDLKNNRIIQRETEDNVSPELEKEFNEFCNRHLAFGKESN